MQNSPSKTMLSIYLKTKKESNKERSAQVGR
jgi:hypothetical protein